MNKVIRHNTSTDDAVVTWVVDEHQARQIVAYCAYDNLGWTKRDSVAAADSAPIGEAFMVGHYRFTIESDEAS
jgi:hypothetical protein